MNYINYYLGSSINSIQSSIPVEDEKDTLAEEFVEIESTPQVTEEFANALQVKHGLVLNEQLKQEEVLLKIFEIDSIINLLQSITKRTENSKEIFEINKEDFKTLIQQLQEIEIENLPTEITSKIKKALISSRKEIQKQFQIQKGNLSKDEKLEVLVLSEKAKRLAKFFDLGIPAKELDNQKLNQLIFESHVYENMFALGHTVKYENNELKFLSQEIIPMFKSGLLTKPEKDLQAEYRMSQKKMMPFYVIDEGSVHTKFVQGSAISYEEFCTHHMIENIKNLYGELTEKEIDSRVRLIGLEGLSYQSERFSDEFFEDNDFVMQFFDKNGALQKELPKIVFPQKYLSFDELVKAKFIMPDGTTHQDVQYLGNGFIHQDPRKWATLEPYTILPESERPSRHTVDVVASFKSDSVTAATGHSYIRMFSPEGYVYTVGITNDEMTLKATRGAMTSPDPRTFVPSSSFKEVTGRYEITPQSFVKLIKLIEGVQSPIDSENQSGQCAFVYQTLTSNCNGFARDVRDYIEHDLEGQRVAPPAKNQITMGYWNLQVENVKSYFIHKGFEAVASSAVNDTSHIKEKELSGFNIKDVEKGVDIEQYKNFGSIENQIKEGTLKIQLARDLALEIISTQP